MFPNDFLPDDYFADENPNANNSDMNSNNEQPKNEASSSKKQGSTPRGDFEMYAVFGDLLPKWDDTQMSMRWKSKAQTTELAENFGSLVMSRNTTGASRGSITSALRKLDDEIDANIEHVKSKLADHLRSKSDAVARYREFGIAKERSYKLPLSREQRVQALFMLTDALAAYNFEGLRVGLEYWTDIRDRYQTLLNAARSTDGSVSSKVGTLNGLRSEVRKFFTAFIFLVRANYPDTWRNELRNFGFQKDKY